MDSIYLTQTQTAIIQLLLEKPEDHVSIRQISRTLGKSYTLTYHNTQALITRKILTADSVPPASVIRIDTHAPIQLLAHVEQTRSHTFLTQNPWCEVYLHDLLKAAPHPFFMSLIFGSYAKGTATKGSDLDLLIIIPHKGDIPAFEAAARKYTKIKKNIIIVDNQDFASMIKNSESFNVGNEARKHHIILYGTEAYHHLLEPRS